MLFRKWVDVGEYPARLSTWAWDIALAPLEDNRFNRSKSNIKILEAAAIEAACLVSDVQPYAEFFDLSSSRFSLCSTLGQWREKLRALIEDVELRSNVTKEIGRVAREFYNIDSVKNNWIKLFGDVCR